MKFLQENIFLIVMAFISGGMLMWPMVARRQGGASLNNVGATRLINDSNAQVLDVRAANEFTSGHLTNAKNIPLVDLSKRIDEVKKDKPVIVVCARGTSAAKAAVDLRKAGIAEVFVLDGGLQGWVDAGLPTVKNSK